MSHYLWVHSILPSNQWSSVYVGVPSGHSLSNTRKTFNVSDAESDGRSQDQLYFKVFL